MSFAQRQPSIPLELTRADKQTEPDPGWLDFAGYLVRKFAITGDLLSKSGSVATKTRFDKASRSVGTHRFVGQRFCGRGRALL